MVFSCQLLTAKWFSVHATVPKSTSLQNSEAETWAGEMFNHGNLGEHCTLYIAPARTG